MYPVLQSTLGFIAKGYEMGLILNYVGDQSEKHPDQAVSILSKIVIPDDSLYFTSDTRKSIRNIFSSALDADSETKTKTIEIINIFGERGDYEWRPLLNGLSE